MHDLCSAADVCSRFESNAQSVFKRKFAVFDLNELTVERDIESQIDWTRWDDLDDLVYDDDDDNFLSMESVKRLFRHFGPLIQTMHLDNNDFDDEQRDEILELIATYCAHEDSMLYKLAMHDITIGSHLMPPLKSIFDRLKSLDVTGGSFYAGSELTELTLEDVDLSDDLMEPFRQMLTKLQKCSLFDVRDSAGVFASITTCITQLKSLILVDSTEAWLLEEYTFCAISLLSELEELHLDVHIVSGSINMLAKLKHLKVFSCRCDGVQIDELLNAFAEQNVPIEDLHLSNFTLDTKIASNMAKLTKLKKLRLSNGEAESGQLLRAVKGMLHLGTIHLDDFKDVLIDEIKSVIEHAVELNELRLEYQQNDKQFNCATKDFNAIGRFVAARVNGVKLTLYVSGSECKLAVPANILETNSRWLEVKVFDSYVGVGDPNIIDYYDDSEQSESSESETSESE